MLEHSQTNLEHSRTNFVGINDGFASQLSNTCSFVDSFQASFARPAGHGQPFSEKELQPFFDNALEKVGISSLLTGEGWGGDRRDHESDGNINQNEPGLLQGRLSSFEFREGMRKLIEDMKELQKVIEAEQPLLPHKKTAIELQKEVEC